MNAHKKLPLRDKNIKIKQDENFSNFTFFTDTFFVSKFDDVSNRLPVSF